MATPTVTLRTAPEFQPVLRRLNAALRQHPDLAPLVMQIVEGAESVGPPGSRLPRVLARLRAARAELERAGIRRAAVFGSVARGDDGPHSDIDILIEADPDRCRTLGDVGVLMETIARLFGSASVDVALKDDLRPEISARVLAEAVYAF